MADVPFTDLSTVTRPDRTNRTQRTVRGLLEQIERWVSRSEHPAQDSERAVIDCLAAQYFWGDPRILPSARRG